MDEISIETINLHDTERNGNHLRRHGHSLERLFEEGDQLTKDALQAQQHEVVSCDTVVPKTLCSNLMVGKQVN